MRITEFFDRNMTELQADAENYWQNELMSLGIELKRRNKLNDKKELQALVDTIKQAYYQDYKTALVKKMRAKSKHQTLVTLFKTGTYCAFLR